MQSMEGWQLVNDYIVMKLSYHKLQLLGCPLEEVMKHRNMIEAYNSIPFHLEGIITESLTT